MKRSRSDKDPPLEIDLKDLGPIVGKGTYAVTVASRSFPNLYVYRVELLITERSDVDREIAIQKLLAEANLSPCIPRIYATMTLKRAFTGNDTIDQQLLLRVKKHYVPLERMEVIIVMMESGNAGNMTTPAVVDRLQKDADFFEKTFFMLLWTFWAANSRYGFRHRDIKPANVVFKKFEKPQVFYFNNDFRVETDMLPMLIDYGFASLLTTRSEHRYLVGTTLYVPPEILLRQMMFNKNNINVSGNSFHIEDSFDVWSIATAMGYTLAKRHLFWLNAGRFPKTRPVKEHSITITHIAGFMVAMYQGITPDKTLMNAGVYSNLMVDDDLYDELVDATTRYGISSTYSSLVESKQLEHHIALLGKFFYWDPRKRVGNNFYSKLAETFHRLRIRKQLDERVDAAYKVEKRPLFELNKDEEFKLRVFQELATVQYIRNKVCDTCQIEPARFVCTCCGHVICDENCH